jgi:AcrR family transcriptional regulator
MPRASAADAARTAERILAAAVSSFNQDGYAAASVDEVARTAGVTRGAVYHHFDNKRGLLLACVRQGHERVAAAVRRVADSQATPIDQLRAGCHAFIDAITADEAARLMLIDGPAEIGWAQWRALDAANSASDLRDAIQLVAPPASVEPLTHLLSGAMNEGALWLMEHPGDIRSGDGLHAALDLLIDAVASQRPR